MPPVLPAVRPPLPAPLPREANPFYIGATDAEIGGMLGSLGLASVDQLFAHLPAGIRYEGGIQMPAGLAREALGDHLFELSQRNRPRTSFLGDGLQSYQVPDIVPYVCGLRGLATAYTPYQPERSQGTLQGLWLYQSAMATLTGFEAVNASLYDRSTAIFEACNTARRLVPGSDTVIVLESLYPGDREVLETLARNTSLKIRTVKMNPKTGVVDINEVRRVAGEVGKGKLAGVVFPQVNCLGNLEDVHALTDLCGEFSAKSIAVIDPMLLATGGLIPPSKFGTKEQGADMFVGEGQHIAIGPNFGGPGLGIFGIRYRGKGDDRSIGATAGRYVGDAKDASGRRCKVSIKSSGREQHVRREKATSNICSNQAFVALLAGAAILYRGEEGMKEACRKGFQNARQAVIRLARYEGVDLAFPETPFFNEVVLRVSADVDELIERARKFGIHLGVNVSSRIGDKENHSILISFTDLQTEEDLDLLQRFFASEFAEETSKIASIPAVPVELLREGAVGLPTIGSEELRAYYKALSDQNVSPDEIMYPLGSCTMKFNPPVNDVAASFPHFTQTHPQAPIADLQGNLELLYKIQEMFKAITGLAAVTTQPVAGAQGELVALKMFQAYHDDRGEGETRRIILIPKSAHGTNPATAATAGYEIVEIEADATGKMDMEKLRTLVKEHGENIAGIMVTNPNTSGVFETRFKEMADLIHGVGGLVFMDGANMNAIAGWVDLGKLGVDAVHNNLHKTWSIPHGGGGPGDGMVAVSERLAPFLPGVQVVKGPDGSYSTRKTPKSIGSFHRHFGNFAHKVRAYTYLLALGPEGVKKMSAAAVLAARYLYKKISEVYPTFPKPSQDDPIMHEFIVTLTSDLFEKIASAGTRRPDIIGRIGRLFSDYGLHAPTAGFPEHFGMMIEPTESYSQAELDRFAEIVLAIYKLLDEHPQVLTTAPHFTPVDRIDETAANRDPVFSEMLDATFRLPEVLPDRTSPQELAKLPVDEISRRIVAAHQAQATL